MEEPKRTKLNTWWDSLEEIKQSRLISKYHHLLAVDQELFMEDIEIMYNQEH